MDVKERRLQAMDIFESALRSSRVEPAMERRVRLRDGVLEVDELPGSERGSGGFGSSGTGGLHSNS